MDIFGSESDSDDNDPLELFLASSFLSLMRLHPYVRRSARQANYLKEEGGMVGTDLVELIFPRFIAIVIESFVAQDAAVQGFMKRLSLAGFTNVVLNPESGLFDAILHYEPGGIDQMTSIAARYATPPVCPQQASTSCMLIAGGTLLLVGCATPIIEEKVFPEVDWLPAASVSSIASISANKTRGARLSETVSTEATVSASAGSGAAKTISACDAIAVRRRGVGINPKAAIYWGGSEGTLRASQERELLAKVTVYPSVAEVRLRSFADDTHREAVQALRDYGVVVFPGIFDTSIVDAWGAAALGDFEEALCRVYEKHNIDLLNPGSGPKIENFRELGMREALRCDIRNGRRMKALAAEEAAAEAAAGTSSSRTCRHLRNHPAIQSVLSQLANPAPYDARTAKGNWGRWNFEGFGPEAPPPPLNVNQVGGVMSLPGCADQTIHADTAHLYLHVSEHMPPAYFNLFVPALRRDRLEGAHVTGQTAFVVGTHILQKSAAVMCEEGGQEKLEQWLLRPHLCAGDALIFDCRVLHFGLANQTQPLPPLETWLPELQSRNNSSISLWNQYEHSACRALLYINYTQPWFVDPKNWNNNVSLFEDKVWDTTAAEIPILAAQATHTVDAISDADAQKMGTAAVLDKNEVSEEDRASDVPGMGIGVEAHPCQVESPLARSMDSITTSAEAKQGFAEEVDKEQPTCVESPSMPSVIDLAMSPDKADSGNTALTIITEAGGALEAVLEDTVSSLPTPTAADCRGSIDSPAGESTPSPETRQRRLSYTASNASPGIGERRRRPSKPPMPSP